MFYLCYREKQNRKRRLQDRPMFSEHSARIGVQQYVAHARLKVSSLECRRAAPGRDEPIVVEFPYDCGRAFHCLSALVSRSKPSTLTDAVSSSKCAPSAAESAIQQAPSTRRKCACENSAMRPFVASSRSIRDSARAWMSSTFSPSGIGEVHTAQSGSSARISCVVRPS